MAHHTRWVFEPHDQAKTTLLDDKDTKIFLQKWSLADSMRCTKFRFDQKFQPHEAESFLLDLFKDVKVLETIQVLTSAAGSWGPLGKADSLTKVVSTPVTCSATSMAFFDRLYECGVLHENGSICGCVPEVIDGLEIHNELDKVLFAQEDERFAVFSPADRSEFLFHIFKLLCYGGPLNQYEDGIGPYFDMAKKFYKELTSVSKTPGTGTVTINSSIFRIDALEGLTPLFPKPGHVQNTFVVSIDPQKRTVTLWYHAWCGD